MGSSSSYQGRRGAWGAEESGRRGRSPGGGGGAGGYSWGLRNRHEGVRCNDTLSSRGTPSTSVSPHHILPRDPSASAKAPEGTPVPQAQPQMEVCAVGALTTSPSGRWRGRIPLRPPGPSSLARAADSPAGAPAGSKLPTTPSPVQQAQTPSWAHSRQGVGGDADTSVPWP